MKRGRRVVADWHDRILRGPGCWEWDGAHTGDGYSALAVRQDDGRQRILPVHRLTYEEKYGPIPEGRVLDHFRCDNKGCVNPDHVRPVTQRENILRAKARLIDDPSGLCPRGHDLNLERGVTREGYTKCKACMREYQASYLRRKANA